MGDSSGGSSLDKPQLTSKLPQTGPPLLLMETREPVWSAMLRMPYRPELLLLASDSVEFVAAVFWDVKFWYKIVPLMTVTSPGKVVVFHSSAPAPHVSVALSFAPPVHVLASKTFQSTAVLTGDVKSAEMERKGKSLGARMVSAGTSERDTIEDASGVCSGLPSTETVTSRSSDGTMLKDVDLSCRRILLSFDASSDRLGASSRPAKHPLRATACFRSEHQVGYVASYHCAEVITGTDRTRSSG